MKMPLPKKCCILVYTLKAVRDVGRSKFTTNVKKVEMFENQEKMLQFIWNMQDKYNHLTAETEEEEENFSVVFSTKIMHSEDVKYKRNKEKVKQKLDYMYMDGD